MSIPSVVVIAKARRIGVVEDDRVFAAALLEYLAAAGYEAQHWPSAEAFWRDESGRSLDVLFLDIVLPGLSGIDLAGLITVRDPGVRKIVLTTIQTDGEIFKALRCGCLGYVLKSDLPRALEAIELVLGGGALMSPTIALKVMSSFDSSEARRTEDQLSPRERQVLEQLVDGAGVARVAELLDLSIHTVRNHLKSIYEKLSVSNRQELMRRARELGYF